LQESHIPDHNEALHLEVLDLFSDVQLEMVVCETCGSYHPPGIHLASITPLDPAEPEEA
jgi:hypothetical protein